MKTVRQGLPDSGALDSDLRLRDVFVERTLEVNNCIRDSEHAGRRDRLPATGPPRDVMKAS